MVMRVLLIGLGRMGRNHLRVLSEHPRFRVVGAVDPALPAAPIPVVRSLDDWTADCDCAVVAAPASAHYAIGCALVARKIPVLMEKPLCATSEPCRDPVRRAQKNGVPLAVGHTERFNPAVQKLREIAHELGRPLRFELTRAGGAPKSDVLFDLAVHDIDIFRLLAGGARLDGAAIESGAATLHLSSQSGATAIIYVDRIAQEKIRSIRVRGPRGECFVDYVRQTCALGGRDLHVDSIEPLFAQASQFFSFVRRSDAGALCLGDDATAAVWIAERASADHAMSLVS